MHCCTPLYWIAANPHLKEFMKVRRSNYETQLNEVDFSQEQIKEIFCVPAPDGDDETSEAYGNVWLG